MPAVASLTCYATRTWETRLWERGPAPTRNGPEHPRRTGGHRRLYASGRSSVSLNGNPITLGMLKQVAENLVDVHGQHDHQYLLKPSNQTDVLDQFGGLWPLRNEYHDIFLKVLEAKRRIDELAKSGSVAVERRLYRAGPEAVARQVVQRRAGPAQRLDQVELVGASAIVELLVLLLEIVGELDREGAVPLVDALDFSPLMVEATRTTSCARVSSSERRSDPPREGKPVFSRGIM